MKRFLIALQFLTIVPLKIKGRIKDEDFGRALVYFPVIGLLIGLLLSLEVWILAFLPHMVTAALVLLTSIVITGGIHLDGFADTCDAFYGPNTKKRILEIMRDSRIGSIGAIGIALLLVLKFSLIVSIRRETLWKSLIMMTVFARYAQVFACSISDYARIEGKARPFIKYASYTDNVAGAIFTFTIFVLLAFMKGAVLFILVFIPVFIFTEIIKKRIDGMTGDTIGAISEIAEISVLFFALLWNI
ncbi:MAG: adenosylcobinamide-GDP ribazoletransferase [Candidatus Omnitrophica bacterium]|nr:adenosylcobinamide-GDP ribazoletransferase [Candidatus Omnitrophota bacterium]